MEPRRIGLYLKDTELARQLVNYWKKKAPQYRFCVYEEETVQNAWDEGGWYRFLTDENGKRFLAAARGAERVRILSDRENQEGAIFRYQSADQILAQVLGMKEEEKCPEGTKESRPAEPGGDRILEEGPPRLPVPKTGKSVTGIYSPVGRCGKSRFALALGKVWGEKERVLYLSLEVFSDLYEWLTVSGGGDFSDLLYYQEQGGLTVQMWERLVRPWQGLAVVGPAANPEDILALEAVRCEAILAGAFEAGYEKILLDVGTCHPDPTGILALCGQIYAPVTEEESSRRKWRHFTAYLEKTGRQELLQRITTIQLPEGGGGYEAGGLPDCGEEMELFAREVLCWNN